MYISDRKTPRWVNSYHIVSHCAKNINRQCQLSNTKSDEQQKKGCNNNYYEAVGTVPTIEIIATKLYFEEREEETVVVNT